MIRLINNRPIRNGWARLKIINGREKICCGLCGYEYAREPGDIHNYCPACGAKMKKTYTHIK